MFQALFTAFSPSNAPNDVGTVVISIFQMMKLRHTEGKKPAWGHTARKWQGWASNPGRPSPALTLACETEKDVPGGSETSSPFS